MGDGGTGGEKILIFTRMFTESLFWSTLTVAHMSKHTLPEAAKL